MYKFLFTKDFINHLFCFSFGLIVILLLFAGNFSDGNLAALVSSGIGLLFFRLEILDSRIENNKK